MLALFLVSAINHCSLGVYVKSEAWRTFNKGSRKKCHVEGSVTHAGAKHRPYIWL